MNIDAVIEPHIQTTPPTATTGQVEVTPARSGEQLPRVSQKLPLKVAVQMRRAAGTLLLWYLLLLQDATLLALGRHLLVRRCDATTMFLSHLSSLLFGSILVPLEIRRFLHTHIQIESRNIVAKQSVIEEELTS